MTQVDPLELRGNTVLVIGATGFLGSHLVQRLSQIDCRVVGMSRSADPRWLAPSGTTWRRGDASDEAQVAETFKAVRPDIIYHLTSDSRGGRDLELVPDSMRNDLIAAVNVLVQASHAGVKRLVLAGSFEEPEGDADEAVPSSPYAAAKWASSAYARMISDLHGLPVTVLRLMMTYGPGQKDYKVIPYTISSLLRGEKARLSSGSRAVDWVYIDDVVDALIRAAVAPHVDARSIDIGCGRLVTLKDSLGLIGDMLEQPDLLDFGAVDDRPMERERAAKTRAAALRLGWRARTDLASGLRQTIEWYRGRV